MERIRTGLYGGSFNPIHNGHVAVARQMIDCGAVDEVWFMVSPQNPLKQRDTLLDDDSRMSMAVKALEGEPRMRACDYERSMPRPSYTWHTLQSLWRDFPQREFVLMIGADNWHRFDRWYHAADIARTCRILIYPRRGYPIDEQSLPSNVRLINTTLHDVSSSEIRQCVSQGRNVSRLVPSVILPMVEQYYATATQK